MKIKYFLLLELAYRNECFVFIHFYSAQKFFFKLLEKTKLTRLVSWVKRPI